MRLKYSCFGLFLIILAASNLFAQNDFWKESENIDALLLKKDLTLAIKEAEKSSSNDLRSLLRRLRLYYRAVNNAKIAATVKQIADSADLENNRYNTAESVKYAVKDELFKDAETLRVYLQKIYFDSDVYTRFSRLCVENQSGCDVSGFDEWLARKASNEARAKDSSAYYNWTSIRIGWRERFGLDNTVILNQFATDARENPADLETALRYLHFLRKPPEVRWLAENFASKQAYHYYELGGALAHSAVYSDKSADEARQILQIAAALLQKSLSLPYSKEDGNLINSRQMMLTSMPSRKIINYEKQLRFWTKTKLAETYKFLNEAQNAQPLVEELAALDKSDIEASSVSRLAGAVQMASGARVVESKILNEQALRQNSYEYWWERVAYYQGRQESERVFDAYRQALAVVPFDITDEGERSGRLFYVRHFADFVEGEFSYYSEKTGQLTDEENRKMLLWKEAESFFRAEFEKTKSNLDYSSSLTDIIHRKFKKLLDEIFSRNPGLLIAFAEIDALQSGNGWLYYFLQSESVSKMQKDATMNEILKIAQRSGERRAWAICERVIGGDAAGIYAARVVPILVKNLEKVERRFKSSSISEEEKEESENLRDKYLENLFRAHLAANDWKSAEKIVLAKYNSSLSYRLWQLAENAAKNCAYSEALRFWKLKANLNRRDLDYLESLARFSQIEEGLREFYQQMKANEPFSPIPDIALRKLK